MVPIVFLAYYKHAIQESMKVYIKKKFKLSSGCTRIAAWLLFFLIILLIADPKLAERFFEDYDNANKGNKKNTYRTTLRMPYRALLLNGCNKMKSRIKNDIKTTPAIEKIKKNEEKSAFLNVIFLEEIFRNRHRKMGRLEPLQFEEVEYSQKTAIANGNTVLHHIPSKLSQSEKISMEKITVPASESKDELLNNNVIETLKNESADTYKVIENNIEEDVITFANTVVEIASSDEKASIKKVSQSEYISKENTTLPICENKVELLDDNVIETIKTEETNTYKAVENNTEENIVPLVSKAENNLVKDSDLLENSSIVGDFHEESKIEKNLGEMVSSDEKVHVEDKIIPFVSVVESNLSLGNVTMKRESQKDKEKSSGVFRLLKELFKNEGFDNLPKLKDILRPLKEIIGIKGFEKVDALKDTLVPIEEIEFLNPIHGKGAKESSKFSEKNSFKSDEDNNKIEKSDFSNARGIGISNVQSEVSISENIYDEDITVPLSENKNEFLESVTVQNDLHKDKSEENIGVEISSEGTENNYNSDLNNEAAGRIVLQCQPSNINDMIRYDYRGAKVTVLLPNAVTFTGEVVFDFNGILTLKKDNTLIFINEKYIIGFY